MDCVVKPGNEKKTTLANGTDMFVELWVLIEFESEALDAVEQADIAVPATFTKMTSWIKNRWISAGHSDESRLYFVWIKNQTIVE